MGNRSSQMGVRPRLACVCFELSFSTLALRYRSGTLALSSAEVVLLLGGTVQSALMAVGVGEREGGLGGNANANA
jgi:hypothetical protein